MQKEWNLYQHSSKISVPRALAVHDVLHNDASYDTWGLLDAWVKEQGLESVLEQIVGILELNGVSDSEREREWWKSHLTNTIESNPSTP